MLLRIILNNLLFHFSLGVSVCLDFCLKFKTSQKCSYRNFMDNWTSIFVLGVEFLRGRALSWSLKHVNYRRNIRINSLFIFGLAILRGRAPSCTVKQRKAALGQLLVSLPFFFHLEYLHVWMSACSFKQVKNAQGELGRLLRFGLSAWPRPFLHCRATQCCSWATTG